jgi:fatty-acyl-CoA synthase
VGADGAGGPVRRAGRQSLRPALRHHRHPELVLPRDAGLVPGPAAGLPETGAEGELSARGPIVTRGYFNDPERTAAQIDADGWFRSGDLGRVRDDGYLELTGRSSELFKVGGELVAPQQVEQVLTGYQGVAQAYVAGVPDERLGEVGCAWIVTEDGAQPSQAELLSHCRRHLAAFKVPRQVRFLGADDLPKTSTGKVQKYRLVRDHLDR